MPSSSLPRLMNHSRSFDYNVNANDSNNDDTDVVDDDDDDNSPDTHH